MLSYAGIIARATLMLVVAGILIGVVYVEHVTDSFQRPADTAQLPQITKQLLLVSATASLPSVPTAVLKLTSTSTTPTAKAVTVQTTSPRKAVEASQAAQDFSTTQSYMKQLKARCLEMRHVEDMRLLPSTMTHHGNGLFCVCKRSMSSSGDGSVNHIDFGPYPVQKDVGVFPVNCTNCKCNPPVLDWDDALEKNFTVFGINRGLSDLTPVKNNRSSPGMFPNVSENGKDGPSIDLVTCSVSGDYHVFLHERGMLSFFKYIQNVRTLTIIGRRGDLPLLIEIMRQNPKIYEMGAMSPLQYRVPPIHFVDEGYFRARYEIYFKSPYLFVFQQLMKLHVFDLLDLLPNVLIVDSDTVWANSVQFVFPNNSAIYHGDYLWGTSDKAKLCRGMDSLRFFNTMIRGPLPLPDGQAQCKIDFCQEENAPVNPKATGIRHVTHHMLFQRDVMAHLHQYIKSRWEASSFWEGASVCFKLDECKGRVTEYEFYHQYAICNFPERVIDRLLSSQYFKTAAGDCSLEEMERCHIKGVLMKGCHEHRNNSHMGQC